MNTDLEKQLLQLKPKRLPDDLLLRLKKEPQSSQEIETLINSNERSPDLQNIISIKQRSSHWKLATGVAAVAACFIFFISSRGHQKTNLSDSSPHSDLQATNFKQISNIKKVELLVKSTSLGTEEINGELWEIVEEEWIDNTIATHFISPITISAQELRKEIVFQPVVFQ